MANNVWTGATDDGSWATAGNWTDGVPDSGDICYFTSGNKSVFGGLDQSSIDLGGLYIGRGYTGNIGSSGSPVNIGVNGNIIIDGGGQEIHFGTGGTYDWVNVLVAYPGLNGNGNVSLTATGGAAILAVARGNVAYKAGTTALVVIQSGTQGGGTATLTATGGTFTALEQNAGAFYLSGATVTTHRMHGGSAKIISGTYTNCYQDGGNILWNNTGTLTLLHGMGGFFDASQIATARTITTVYGHAGWQFTKASNVTLTNDYSTLLGGQIVPNVGIAKVM